MRVISIILLVLVSTGAVAQKKLIKQALAYEKSGLYDQAAQTFMQAYHQNATKPETIQGLKRTSDKVVETMLSDFFIAKNSGETEAAIAEFDEILKYKKQLKYFEVTPDIPGYYYDDYEALKQRRVEEIENKAADKKESQAAEAYDKAVSLFDSGRLSEAWQAFDEVETIIVNYKDTWQYKSRIKEQATTLSIVIGNRNRFNEVELFKDNLDAEVAQLQNPLIRIVTRSNLDEIIEEQKLGLSGVLEESSAARLGRILGVKNILLVKLINYDYIPGEFVTTTKTAYKPRLDGALDNLGLKKITYKSVNYTEYVNSSRILATFQYQLIATESGEVLTADVLREAFEDENTYAEYSGNYLDLYPSDGENIYKKGPVRDEFLAMFEAKRIKLSEKEMEFKVQEVLSKKMAQSVNEYFR